MTNEYLLHIAIEASVKAGQAIMEVYDTSFEVEIKKDKSPLTEADKKANDIIQSFLEQTLIPIISEENKQIDYSVRKKWDSCWVVDPLDGTKEFINRNGEFTVNIALIKEGLPIIGVIYVPESKTLFFANVYTNKAFKTKLSSQEIDFSELIKNSDELKPKSTTNELTIVGSRSHMNTATIEYINSLKKAGKNVEVVSKGSSLKFCMVAEGKADIYPRFAPTMEWDTAAGQAICNAVSIKVISNESQEELRYNKENLLNPWFMVLKQ